MNGLMTPADVYAYLVRARRDLWAVLEQVADEVLSRPMLDGERFHSIKGVFREFRDDDVTSGAPLGIVNGTEVSHDRAGIRCAAEAAGRVGGV